MEIKLNTGHAPKRDMFHDMSDHYSGLGRVLGIKYEILAPQDPQQVTNVQVCFTICVCG